ncbi:unnamed protein product [Scytosiphon promiscuus]
MFSRSQGARCSPRGPSEVVCHHWQKPTQSPPSTPKHGAVFLAVFGASTLTCSIPWRMSRLARVMCAQVAPLSPPIPPILVEPALPHPPHPSHYLDHNISSPPRLNGTCAGSL